MFRKVSNIFVTFLLLVSTTGFSISKHYCGNELVFIKLIGEAKSCCESGTCCHTDSEIVQLRGDFVNAATEVNFDNNLVINIIQFQLQSRFISIEIENRILPLIRFESPPPPKILTKLADLQTFLL